MASSKAKEAEYRQNLIGSDFLSCPPDQLKRVFITGEILSAEDFPKAEIFLSYKITLPNGWKVQNPEFFDEVELTQQQTKELNCLESITHSVSPLIERNEEGTSITKFYFCFPIDLQLIVVDKNITGWPTIHLEVYSKDFWDRVYMHGCGFAKFPTSEGTHNILIPTWKPTLDTKTKISEFFLGGMIRPKNIEEISQSQKINELDQPGPVNRILYNSISGGNIKLRLNIATQSKRVKTAERINFKAFKFSEQIETKKSQLTSNIPSLVNTGTIHGGRYTNTVLP